MDVAALLTDLFDRIPPLGRRAVDGLAPERLAEAPRPGANTIAWLVWHTARVQDAQVAPLVPAEQLWVTGDWAARTGLPADPGDTGFAHRPEQVAAVRPPDGDVLVDYLDAVAARTREYVAGLTAADLDRVVDQRWDPPVTLGVRLVSIAGDCLQHAGQAAYARGLLDA
jgi:DinB superfamily